MIATQDLRKYVLSSPLAGTYCNWVGSSRGAVARVERHPSTVFAQLWKDIDFFFSSKEALMFGAAKLLDAGASPLNEGEERKLKRWMRFGMGHFDTHSLRLETLQGVEFNLVFKSQDGKPYRTAAEQVGSFDFSNVSMSTDMRTGETYDLFEYYWPGGNPDMVRMFPEREEQWLTGTIGKHTGSRQAGRYATNYARGYDMELCKLPLVTGYRIVAVHYLDQDDDVLNDIGRTYLSIASLIEDDDIDALLYAYSNINPHSKIASIAAAIKEVRP